MDKIHYKATKRIPIENMVLRSVTGKHHISNVIFLYDGSNYRVRGEVLVFKDNTVFLYIKQKYKFNKYNIPGGGYELTDKDTSESAIRECKEEARMNIKNIQYVTSYFMQLDDVQDWVKEDIPNKKDQWKDYYTDLYIANYDSEYRGRIDKEDEEKDMVIFGKFYEINGDLLRYLNPYHRKGVEMYLKNK